VAAAGDIPADVDGMEYFWCSPAPAYRPAGGTAQLTWREDAYLAAACQDAAVLALLVFLIGAGIVDVVIAWRLAEQAVELARQLGAGRLLIESLATFSTVCFVAGEPEKGLPPGAGSRRARPAARR
jgi:hypothetical protein